MRASERNIVSRQKLRKEPDNCPSCGARRQWNVDGEIVHARAGSVDCPPAPFSEEPVQALLGALFEYYEPDDFDGYDPVEQ